MSILDMWHEQCRLEGQVATLRSQILFKFGCQILSDRYEAVLGNATREALEVIRCA